jgi:hypothetical protein
MSRNFPCSGGLPIGSIVAQAPAGTTLMAIVAQYFFAI